jgi:hypothetical protein
VEAVNAQIILADIDNDNSTELIFDDNTITNGMGAYMPTQGATIFVRPRITDINHYGVMDMIGAGSVGVTPATTYRYLWNTETPYSGSQVQIPMFQYNTTHDRVYTPRQTTTPTPTPTATPTPTPNSNSHGDSYSNANGYCHPDRNLNARSHSDTEALPDPGTAN